MLFGPRSPRRGHAVHAAMMPNVFACVPSVLFRYPRFFPCWISAVLRASNGSKKLLVEPLPRVGEAHDVDGAAPEEVLLALDVQQPPQSQFIHEELILFAGAHNSILDLLADAEKGLHEVAFVASVWFVWTVLNTSSLPPSTDALQQEDDTGAHQCVASRNNVRMERREPNLHPYLHVVPKPWKPHCKKQEGYKRFPQSSHSG